MLLYVHFTEKNNCIIINTSRIYIYIYPNIMPPSKDHKFA